MTSAPLYVMDDMIGSNYMILSATVSLKINLILFITLDQQLTYVHP